MIFVVNLKRILMSKMCTRCKKEKSFKHFSKRNLKSKKTGKAAYLSHCKSCRSRNSPPPKHEPIDEKWLKRGFVSGDGGNGFTQFTQE